MKTRTRTRTRKPARPQMPVFDLLRAVSVRRPCDMAVSKLSGAGWDLDQWARAFALLGMTLPANLTPASAPAVIDALLQSAESNCSDGDCLEPSPEARASAKRLIAMHTGTNGGKQQSVDQEYMNRTLEGLIAGGHINFSASMADMRRDAREIGRLAPVIREIVEERHRRKAFEEMTRTELTDDELAGVAALGGRI